MDSKFNEVCKKIIIEHQLFSEDYQQRMRNRLEFDWSHPFTTGLGYPSKSIRRFVQSSGMYKLNDKQYLCILIDDEQIDQVIYFENQFGTFSNMLKIEDEDQKKQCVERYNKLLEEMQGYYLLTTLPKKLNSASKTLTEGIFNHAIQFKLTNGKSKKSKSWTFDAGHKTTSQEITDWIENKLNDFGLELNDRVPYPEDVIKHPMVLFFAFGRDNAENIVNQFKVFGVELEVVKNDEGIIIGIDHKTEKIKPRHRININNPSIERDEDNDEEQEIVTKIIPPSPRKKGRDVNMSISEFYALTRLYGFKPDHNRKNEFTKKQDNYIIKCAIDKDDCLNRRLNHGYISFGVSKDNSEYEDFGDDKLWKSDERVEDLVGYIEEHIREIFSDESFELKMK